jgi:hypothetical protein
LVYLLGLEQKRFRLQMQGQFYKLRKLESRSSCVRSFFVWTQVAL